MDENQEEMVEDISYDMEPEQTEETVEPEAEVQQEVKPEETQETTAEAEKDELVAEYYGENGDLDVGKYLDAFKAPDAPAVLQKPAEAAAAAEEADPLKTELEARKSYRTTLKSNLTMGLGYAREILPQVPEEARGIVEKVLQMAEQKVSGDAQEEYDNWLLERQTANETAREKEFREKLEGEKLAPQSRMNHNAVATESKLSPQKLEKLLFTPKYGGEVVNWLFKTMNPDKMGSKDLQGDMNRWYTKFSSNKENVSFLTGLAKLRLNSSLMPDVIKRAKLAGANQEQGNKMSSVSGQNDNKTRGALNQSNNEVSDWIYNNSPDQV